MSSVNQNYVSALACAIAATVGNDITSGEAMKDKERKFYFDIRTYILNDRFNHDGNFHTMRTPSQRRVI